MQREKNMMFIALAFIFALLASGAILMYMKDYEKRIIRESGTTVAVVATRVNIAPGTRIQDTMLTMMDWPKAKVTTNHFRNMHQVIGKIVKTRIVKGMPVLNDMLLRPGDNMGDFVPENMRALTLYFGKKHAEMSFVQPGSVVDILATFKKKGQTPFTKTILQRVRVMAVNGKTEGEFHSSGEEMINNVTFLVRSEDTEKLTLAKEQATLQLVLRNESDTSESDKHGIDTETMLFGRQEAPAAPQQEAPRQFVPTVIPKQKTVTIIRGTDVQEVRL